MFGDKVVMGSEGFTYCTKAATDTVLWKEAMRVCHTVSHERAPLLKGPAKLLIPRKSSSSFVLIRADGKEYHFTPNTVHDMPRLSEILRDQSTKHQIAWE